jgi:hypothetical protein
VDFGGQYLIRLESSENKAHPWSGKSEKDAEKVFSRTYPAIHEFQQQFRDAMINRCDQGRFFWELRSCDYWQEFEQPKIVYPDIFEHQSFTWDMDGYYAANTCYFIPTKEKWLTALFNSQAVEWFYSNVSNSVRGGYMRSFSDYMRQIPIPSAGSTEQAAMETLVGRILKAKASEADQAVCTALEREIDDRVYRLYALTPDEIKLVEEARA